MLRICPRCEIKKDADEFAKNKNRKDGLSCYCKVCKRLDGKKYNKENREKCAEKLRKWRKKNPEKNKEYGRKYSEIHRDKIIARRRTPEYREKMKILVKNWVENNKERNRNNQRIYKKKNRKKENARGLIAKAVRRNKIVRPKNCDMCLIRCTPDAHHKDYDKPYEVQWLCKDCHMKIHGKLLNP